MCSVVWVLNFISFMFLTVHAASGLVLGKYLDNSLLAFLAGFISHLILDIIPHDALEWKKWRANKIFKFFFTVVFVEAPIMIVIAAILFSQQKLILNWPTFWAVSGAVLLDFLFGFDYLCPRCKIFSFFHRLNNWIHEIITTDYFLPWYQWVPLQVFFLDLFLVIYVL